MRTYFGRALKNITKYGDTDIFPFPIESHVFFDKFDDTIHLLEDYYTNFKDRLTRYPPSNASALVPVGYTGFRWATQIDPLWNAFFLGIVLSIGTNIESARLCEKENAVFSYRLNPDYSVPELFNQKCNWRSFMERSLALAKQAECVVTCDISEFYPRLNHHRLENALGQLRLQGDQASKIMDFLSNFSGTYSFGLPIGGPAARLLSELLLNQIDRLLRSEGIVFCRFADDFHLFTNSYGDAFSGLLFLSERLVNNQGLQLQKAKTRIMSAKEFIATNPLGLESDKPPEGGASPTLKEQSQNLLRLSVRFDPYSPTAADDYELLKKEINRIDLMPLLRAELMKSRIHISLSKKIVSAIRFIDEPERGEAVLSLVENAELLYPVYANISFTAKALYSELTTDIQEKIVFIVRGLLKSESHILQTDLNLHYAIRLIACSSGPEDEEIFNKIYRRTDSIIIRRDIILAMARWRAAYWLSDLRNDFRTISPTERRAFVVASYTLLDEGRHWRRHIKPELSPFELLMKDWAAERSQIPEWIIPL